jgi:nicotinate-nucleotide adenylyltransferase
MPQWKAWTALFEAVNIAVFARPSYSLKALAGQAATRFARFRVPEARARCLVRRQPPAWTFLRIRLHPASATAIRAKAKKKKPAETRTRDPGRTGATAERGD